MGRSIRKVVLRFRGPDFRFLANAGKLRGWVDSSDDGKLDSKENFRREAGEQVLTCPDPASVVSLVADLAERGYELVFASPPTKIFKGDGRPISEMCFVFTSTKDVKLTAEHRERLSRAQDALGLLVKEAIWSAIGFLNPAYTAGRRLDGVVDGNVILSHRVSIVDRDGDPVLVWPRDEVGDRMTDKGKVVLRGQYTLHFTGETLLKERVPVKD